MKLLTAIGLLLLGSLFTLVTVFAFDTPSKDFSDVDYGAYYGEGLGNMINKGVISGYNDGTFRPNNSVSRAELVTILDRYDTDTSNMKAIVCNGGINRNSLSETYKITYDTLCD